ncbi:muscle M-line assembly protein unc-89 isoform X2 [Sitodiplosis mosellana]|uniref:muscle M-line assembly protein unc-89 isoform X2 n=1 Tax=Sitodiplosis mosellana TaxID=263140 RepID=UPI0024448FE7|nr:muscle M-line assembly protein unc-89 isoform X2 [Sitodiplosis mosellana]
MDSSANNSRYNTMDTEDDRAIATTSASPAATETATTISTIILQSHPIQIVVGILQSKNSLHIKIVEITPKLSFLGGSIEETVQMQREHEVVYRKLTTQKTPIDEFAVKAEQLIAEKNANPKLLEAMEHSLNIAWQDLLNIFEQRRHVLNINANFHEKIGICLGKMSSLEVACRDTMLPNEIEAIQDFLNKFKQLRIDVLASVMMTLKEGNELLATLRETAMGGQCDTRPDSIKVEIKKSLAQVELWLEQLHDRRNELEQAWQTRKTQLEQCLAFAILIRDINELQQQLRRLKGIYDNRKHQLDSEISASNAHAEVVEWKNDAVVIRDRAIKITRSTEKLSSTCRFDNSNNNGNNRAYMFLNECTELVEDLDNYEELLSKIALFFEKAEKTLTALRQLETESSNLIKEKMLEKYTLTRLINDTAALVEEPLRLGYALLDRIGRSNPEAFSIEKTIVEIENRRIYLEELYSQYNLDYIKITQTLNEFYESCNGISAWLVSVNKAFFTSNNSMGKSLQEGKLFLQLHHQMLSDLEHKGTEINKLLIDTSQILELIEREERDEVDERVQKLRDSWDIVKTIVENRVDLSTNFIKFLQLAEKLAEMFKCVEQILQSTPDESKLSQIDELWARINSAYTQLKEDGNSFVEHISMVVDDSLERRTTREYVEQILTDFSLRTLSINSFVENWTTIIRERRDIEQILQQIMSKNELSLISASKLDAQLYPILIKQTTDLNLLKAFLHDKLHLFLADIEKAQIEITHHIQTTAALQPKDDKTIDKVTQVLRNLNAIVNKLASIKNDFQSLIDGIVDYIESLITTKNSIDLYFKQASFSSDSKSVDAKIAENEQFIAKIQQELWILSQQKDRLIEQISKQEPFEAKDHDINFVKSLLDIVQDELTSRNSALIERLKSEGDIERFKVNFKAIFEDVDRLKTQINNTEAQLKETLLTSNTKYISYESYEQVIQILDQRIDKFINTSENVCNNNSDAKPFIQNSISELKRYWNDLKRQANELEKNIENMKQYFTVNEQIDRIYREHREYLQIIINQMSFAKNAHETDELINKIDRYISDHESRQLELLKDLAILSKNVYGFDKTIEKYSENIELFQSFFSTKNKLNQLGEQLLEEEKAKEAAEAVAAAVAAEQLRRQQEIEKQQQIKQSTQATEVVDFVPKSIIQQRQSIDITKIAETRQTLTLEEAPRFIHQLRESVVQEGEKCQFVCQLASWQPAIHIEWFKNGVPIVMVNPHYVVRNENDLCTLSIEETLTEDLGLFTCRATNNIGSAETSARLCIQPNEQTEMLCPPKFIKPLTNCRTSSGSSLLWKCFVGGTPLPTCQWFKNDVCIDVSPRYNISYNNGEATLRLDDLCADDAGKYTCVAKNILSVDQCSASLTVNVPPQSIDSLGKNAESDSALQSQQQQIHHIRPEFRTPLSNIFTSVCQAFELDCELVGWPKPDILWKLNGKPLLISDRVKLQHDHDRVKLLIAKAQPIDAGTYTLCAKNIAGIAYTSCEVAVQLEMAVDSEVVTNLQPTVLLPLKDVHAIEGKSVQLQCEISGSPEPEVIWYHENKPVKESSDVQLLFRGDRCSLFIQEAMAEDAGEYRVVALNLAGEASSMCKLSIESSNKKVDSVKNSASAVNATVDGFAPKFEKLLSDILANEGETVELDCVVVGEPKPAIKWFLSNSEIIENDRIQFDYNSENGKTKLILKNVSIDDKGVYTVQATNSLGDAKCFSHVNVKSINASENIPDKQVESDESHHFLEFKEKFSDKSAHIGDLVKFECIVVGKPTPKIRWLFNDRPVQGKQFLPSTSGDRQVLTIPAISNETIGKISCTAENDFHRESCSALLSLTPDLVLPPSSQRTEFYAEEYDTNSSNVTIKKQSTISTHTSQITSFQNGSAPLGTAEALSIQPKEKMVNYGVNDFTQLKRNALLQSSQSKLVSTESLFPKSPKKETAPRFISPFIGKIIEQGSSMTLEAIIDGFPQPEIELTKNGEPLFEKENLNIVRKNNRITISLQDVTTADAGRYSCSATNPIGNALSTADVVVKKSIFPPVFGHRLQAKVAKCGERVIMDIEVSGIPPPTITFYKDDKPLHESNISAHKIRSSGNCYTLVIEKVCKFDAGKYMVKAVNDAGETQSIADFIILEPTPERIVDVVKTVAVENIDEHRAGLDTNTSAISPNSYHSSQTETIKQSDSHGSSEQTIHTETCRITETTMRMEHKSPLPDIEFNPSPRPFESRDQFEIQTKPHAKVVLEPHQKQQQQHHNEYDQLAGHKTFENTRYTTFDAAAPKKAQVFIQEKPSSEAHMGSLPKTNFSSVSQRVKTLEQCEQEVPLYKSNPVWNALNDSPIRHFDSEKPIHTESSTPIYQMNGVGTPNPVNKTLEKISNKMQEYEQTHWLKGYDLKAPALVKHVTPNANHFNGYESKDVALAQPLNMEPGETPEFCFAPRFTSERKPSLVERIEKSLERELEKGPSKVLPYSVRTMPPSPQTVSTETFESTKRTVLTQAKQPEINVHHKDFNHIKNTFYEHNKPLQRNDHIPTPIQAPQNQFNTSVCSNISFTAKENKTIDEHASHRSSSVRFKDNEFERDTTTKIHPIWRPGYDSDTETPQFRSIKPILTPTTGRSSAVSVGPSPIPPSQFEQPQRFTSTSEQLNTISRDFQVLKPKPVSARPFNQSKPITSHSERSTKFYTATAGPPYHNQTDIASESRSHMEIREATESSQRIVNMSSTRKVITYDQKEQQQEHQHHSQSTFEKSLEPFPFTVSPIPSISRQRIRQLPTPTKFVPGEFRESDYDSEIEAMKIRPLWTPNTTESDRLYNYRHVSPPTPRSTSVPRHHFERILTPMDFDVSDVEMPSKIKCLPTSPTYSSQQQNQYKTQTLDRFRSKKKSSSHFGALSSQDDINIMHSTPQYQTKQETRESQYEISREQRVYTPTQMNYTIVGASHDQEKLPKYAPVFVAPLKDIAVLSGHTARFECIVQCDPHPYIEWYRDDTPIRNGSGKYFVEFRNGVCRLTIPETLLSDAGLYTCTGTNHLGSVVTSAELVVNNENWGIRK